MINITYLSGGKLAKASLEKLNKLKSNVIVDCYHVYKKDLKILSEKIDIPLEDFIRALDEDERPSLSEIDHFSRITFHAPLLKDKQISTVPFSIFIKKNIVVIIRTNHIESVERFLLMDSEKKIDMYKRDVTFIIYSLLNEVVNHFFKILDELDEKIQKVDQDVFKIKTEKVVKDIFNLKKTLIYFHKSLTGNREVIKAIEKQFLKDIKGKHVKKFRYLFNDSVQLVDMVDTYRDILASGLDVHLSTVSNNMSEIMKRLTLITSFLLIPSLISSIYGMNFKFMPEIHIFGKFGYPFAIVLMIVSILLTYHYFNKKGWL